MLAFASSALADREFSPRFSANDTGDVALAADTLLTCPAANGSCAAARGGSNASNNSFVMGYLDVDSDTATFDSSRADLTLPAGAQIGNVDEPLVRVGLRAGAAGVQPSAR